MSRVRQLVLLRFALIFIGLVLVQLPFLSADADVGLGFSRGPYTDEGLYTAQVRNAMVTGHLDLAEADGVLKNPLYAFGAWGVLATFGDTMVTLRTAIVLGFAALLAGLAAGSGGFSRLLWVAIPVGLLSYYPFHYGHLALAEMPSCAATLAALYLLHRRLSGGSAWTLVSSGLLMLVAYALKIQFAYVAAIPPITFAVAIVLRWLSGLPVARRAWVDFFASIGIAAAFFALYLAVWVLPNLALFSVVTDQVAARSSSLAQIPKTIWINTKAILKEPGVWPLLLLFALGAVTALREWRATKADATARLAWIALVAPPLGWLAIEAHKLTLNYMPSRYFVSLLVALALLGAAGFATRRGPMFALRRGAGGGTGDGERGGMRVACLGVLLLAVLINAGLYAKALKGRQYAIHDAQTTFAANGQWRGKLAMGPWAPSLFWGSGAITKPIWHPGFNDRNILARFKPTAIVTEPDQGDSSQALSADGITLPPAAEMSTHVGKWDLRVYRFAAP
jgi:hypothetical protein